MNFSKENTRRIRGLILFTVLLFLGIQRFDVVISVLEYIWDLLLPFILGLCIAYILSVPLRFVERVLFSGKRARNSRFLQKIKRPVSLLITFILLIGVISVVLLIVVPELILTGETLYNVIPGFMNDAESWMNDMLERFPFIEEHIGNFEMNWDALTNAIVDFIKNDLLDTLSSTVAVAKDIVSTLLDIFIALFFSIYVLTQKERLGKQVKSVLSAFLSDKNRDRVLRVAKLADTTFSNFFSGQCIEAVILGTMFIITMSIIGFPYAVMIGVLIGFTALIPVLGPFIGCAIGALLILIDSPTKALGFIIMFLVLQLIEENFIYPHVVGNAVGLPAIWVLVAVTVGGSMFGIVGMLFFIPLVSVLYALAREVVHARIAAKRTRSEVLSECAPGPVENTVQEPVVEKTDVTKTKESVVKKALKRRRMKK